jgi:alpha-1,2-mannosyltransferase
LKLNSQSSLSFRQRTRHLLFVTLAGLTLGTYIVFAIIAALNTHNRIGLGGTPLFYDFSVFHQAGVLADTGRAADAYDDSKMIAAQHAAFPGSRMRLPWHYPPTFQFMLMPLGALPYVAAWFVWSCVLYGFYALLARRLVDDTSQVVFLLLAPGVAVNLFVGQNGILSVIFMGAGTLLLRSRPVLGGILMGMMAYKPQFAVLVPLALLAGREWRALIAAVISQVALVLLSAIVIGMAPWLAFLHRIVEPAAVFSSSSSDWRGIPSIMIFARTLGLGAQASAICHWTIAAIATAIALWTWWKTSDSPLRFAALATATVLVTPYLRDYDLALLILPVAALLSRARLTIIEKVVIFVAWLVPAVLMFTSPAIQFGPVVSLALLIVVFWHIVSERPFGEKCK